MILDTTAAARQRGVHSHVVIRSGTYPPLIGARELWAYREVLYALVWREIKIRYAQTLVGMAWVILQPLLTTVLLSVLASRWLKGPTHDLPYPLLAYSGLVLWMYFTHVFTKSSICLISTGLLSKAYFPRLLLPLASAAGGLIDLFVSSVVLAILMIHYGAIPSPAILLLPGVVLLAVIVAFGVGVWLAVLNLYNRDVVHALPFATQLLFFITPAAYPISLVPASLRLAYSLNPFVGIIECWRWVLFGKPLDISLPQLAVSAMVGAAIVFGGLWYFSRMEPTFADVGET
jgi:lipopolysaccharide transport system permease protein